MSPTTFGYINLAFLGVIFIVCIVLCLKNRRYILGREDNVQNEIRQPKLYVNIEILCMVGIYAIFCICLAFAAPYDWEEIIVFSVFADLAYLILVAYPLFLFLNWKIRLYEDHFAYTNFLGITRKYRYDEIVERRYARALRYYYKGRRVITISFLQWNCDALSVAIKKYKKERKHDKKD